MGWKACTWFCWYLHVKLTEWSKNLFVSLVFLLFILILNALRALWHIRSPLVNANHSCCVPGAQPGPMSIHCLSFLSRLIFSMSPLIFLVYACKLAFWLKEVRFLHVSALMGSAVILHKSSCLTCFVPTEAIDVFFTNVAFYSNSIFYVTGFVALCTILFLSHPGLGLAMAEFLRFIV